MLSFKINQTPRDINGAHKLKTCIDSALSNFLLPIVPLQIWPLYLSLVWLARGGRAKSFRLRNGSSSPSTVAGCCLFATGWQAEFQVSGKRHHHLIKSANTYGGIVQPLRHLVWRILSSSRHQSNTNLGRL